MIGSDVYSQVLALEHGHKEVFECIDLDRVESWVRQLSANDDYVDDFGPNASGGRGTSYVAAQRATFTRAGGIAAILDIIADRGRSESGFVVDLLGGDGLVHRVAALLGRWALNVITCDASPFMVESAWAAGVPALRQSAQFPLFRDRSVGGVLLAYGSHHIAVSERSLVVAEARTILRPGGVFLLHDFLVGSAMERWFDEIVDAYSITGHRYTHFEEAEIASYLREAGFADIVVAPLDDPFVVQAPSAADAELAMGRYLVHMYGLTRLIDEFGETGAFRRAYELSRKIFSEDTAAGTPVPEPHYSAGVWTLTLGRKAVVGHGIA